MRDHRAHRSRTVLVAAALVASAAGSSISAPVTPRWAYQKYFYNAAACHGQLEVPRRHQEGEPLAALTIEQVLLKCEAIAREMAQDLKDPAIDWNSKTETLRGLSVLGRAARPVVPAIIDALDDYDEASSEVTRVSSFCRAAEALGAADPKNPEVIRALSRALEREARRRPPCHRCDCAFKALALAGPAAASIAGPVLKSLTANPSFSSPQLGQAIEAIGLSAGLSSSMIESLRPTQAAARGLSYDARISSLKALATNAAQLGPADRQALAEVGAAHLREDYAPLRVAGAQALSGIGRIDLLDGALRDEHYEVRRAALDGLAAAGPRASPYAGAALDALDPYLGTTEAAAKALVAMGRAVAPGVEQRAAAGPESLRPLFAAAARAVSLGDVAPVRETLARTFTRGPHDTGYVRIETRSAGGGKAYDHGTHRIQVDVQGTVYGPGRERAKRIAGMRTEENTTYNPFFLALQGRAAGSRLRMIMSPEVVLSPFAHMPQPGPSLPPGTAGDFEIEIRKVCQPNIWEIFKGGGIFGPMRIETSCS